MCLRTSVSFKRLFCCLGSLVNYTAGDGRDSIEHLHCLAHIINLAVCDAIEGLCGLSSVIYNDGDSDFNKEVDTIETDPSYAEAEDAEQEDDALYGVLYFLLFFVCYGPYFWLISKGEHNASNGTNIGPRCLHR